MKRAPTRIITTASLVIFTIFTSTCLAEAAPARTATPSPLTAAYLPHRSPPPRPGTAASQTRYTVHAGDTLTAIAGDVWNKKTAWPAIFWANRAGIHYADMITTGQRLTIPAVPGAFRAVPAALLAPAPPVRHASPAEATVSATPLGGPQTDAAAATPYNGSGGFQSCVIARESGNNPDIWNATGHWGLYQFSAATWAAYGGSPADFGSASAAEQNQVFANAMARGGAGNWAPYDGC